MAERQKTIRRNLHCEYTPEHFKMHAACEEHNIVCRIYSNNNDTPIIFDGLRKMYEDQGIESYKAAVRARAVVKDFFTVCHKLSELKKPPFVMKIDVLDLTLYNHGKQVPLQ